MVTREEYEDAKRRAAEADDEMRRHEQENRQAVRREVRDLVRLHKGHAGAEHLSNAIAIVSGITQARTAGESRWTAGFRPCANDKPFGEPKKERTQ